MNMLQLLKPMVTKLLPKVRESINNEPLDKEKGEFRNVIMIQFGDETEEGKELPLDFYIVTLAQPTEEGGKPLISKIRQMEGL